MDVYTFSFFAMSYTKDKFVTDFLYDLLLMKPLLKRRLLKVRFQDDLSLPFLNRHFTKGHVNNFDGVDTTESISILLKLMIIFDAYCQFCLGCASQLYADLIINKTID